jgi:hypothetical protein
VGPETASPHLATAVVTKRLSRRTQTIPHGTTAELGSGLGTLGWPTVEYVAVADELIIRRLVSGSATEWRLFAQQLQPRAPAAVDSFGSDVNPARTAKPVVVGDRDRGRGRFPRAKQ